MTQPLVPDAFETLRVRVLDDGLARETLLENAPRFTKIANFLFEQAEYQPSWWLAFDGHLLHVRGVNGHLRYLVDRVGTSHYYTGAMRMCLVDGRLNGEDL